MVDPWQPPNAAVVGAGLIALDVVIDERQREPMRWAGGTCGNLLAILGYMGWRAYPVACFNHAAATCLIAADLKRWSVDLRYLHLEARTNPPVVIQRMLRDRKGNNVHLWSFLCPKCRRTLPRFSPVPATAVQSMFDWPRPRVFFADRVCSSTIVLAERSRSDGAVVVFEPASNAYLSLFNRMLRLAHIVKYSRAEFRSSIDVPDSVLLQVETFGREGLRYRTRLRGGAWEWVTVPAFHLTGLRDAAGSGDWCTAGIIHALAAGGFTTFGRSTHARVRSSMGFAQALATWNCGYVGARGGMYAVKKRQFRAAVEQIMATRAHCLPLEGGGSKELRSHVPGVCPSCLEHCEPL
jgi:sugar/nucleoside kinase (ribokinase family)